MPKITHEDDSSLDENLVSIGHDTDDSISNAFEKMVQQADDAGLESQHRGTLESLLAEFRNIWRLKLGPGPAVNIEPMKILLKLNARPVMCKSRRYPPIHSEYMAHHVAELVEFGLVYPNHHSSWASSPLIVPKPNSKSNFRMTVDVRRVNEQTVLTA